MKRFILPLVAATAMANAAEPLTVPVGGNKSVTVEFEAKEYALFGNKEAVKVGLLPEPGGTRVRIDGVKLGNCDVSVLNARGGDGAVFSVEVVENDVDAIYRQLRTRLDREGVPALDVSKSKNTVVVSGTLDNRTDWGKLRRVLELQEFRGKVENMVEFSVDPKVIAALRAQLAKAGFKLSPEGEPYGDGELSLTYEHNVVTVAGTVFSEAERAKITTLLGGHKTWLEVVDSPSANADSPIAQGVVAVGLDDAQVELTVAIIAYSESKVKNFGNQNRGLSLTAPVNMFLNLVNGRYDRSAGVGMGLDSLVEFEEGEIFNRDLERASIRFKCNAPDEARIKFGGTLKVKLTTKDQNGNPVENFEDIQYGFNIIKKEGRRVTADTVEMKLFIEQRTTPDYNAEAGSFNLREYLYEEPVLCKIGHTTKIGDYQKLNETTRMPTGTPFLRNVPILSWFVSQEGYKDEDKKVMILASVRLVKPGEEPAVPLKEMEDVSPMIEISTEEIAEQRRDKTVWWLLPWTWTIW